MPARTASSSAPRDTRQRHLGRVGQHVESEPRAEHGRDLEQLSACRAEAADPRAHDREDRPGNLVRQTGGAVAEQAQHLDDEQRVAAGAAEDHRDGVVSGRVGGSDECSYVGFSQWSQRNGVGTLHHRARQVERTLPTVPDVACGGDDHGAHAWELGRNLCQQLQRRRPGAVEIVEDDEERCRPGRDIEDLDRVVDELSARGRRPVGAVGGVGIRRLLTTEQCGVSYQAADHGVVRSECSRELGPRVQRAVRSAAAPAANHPETVGVGAHLVRQSGLADSGRTGQEHQRAVPGARPFDDGRKLRDDGRPSDKWRLLHARRRHTRHTRHSRHFTIPSPSTAGAPSCVVVRGDGVVPPPVDRTRASATYGDGIEAMIGVEATR